MTLFKCQMYLARTALIGDTFQIELEFRNLDIYCSNHNSPSSVHLEWNKQKAIGVSLAEMTVEELERIVRQFYTETKQ